MKFRSIVNCALLISAVSLSSCSSSSSTDPTDKTKNDNTPTGIIDLNVSDTTSSITTLDLDQKLVTNALLGSGPERTGDGTIIYQNNDNDLIETTASGLNKQIIVHQNLGVPFDDRHDDHMSNPRLSPDRKSIVYEGINGNLYVVTRATGSVTASWEFSLQNPGSYFSPSWTTLGKIVVSGGDQNPGLYLLDPATKAVSTIGTGLTMPQYPNVSYLDQICFVMNGYIYTMNVNGSDLKQFSDASTTWLNTARFPTWSPRADWIVTFANLDSLKILPVSSADAVVNASQTFSFPAGVVFDNTISQISWR